ncbi:MAG: hypothetical protein WB564_01770 [Dehalococcoidia bacterium]
MPVILNGALRLRSVQTPRLKNLPDSSPSAQSDTFLLSLRGTIVPKQSLEIATHLSGAGNDRKVDTLIKYG